MMPTIKWASVALSCYLVEADGCTQGLPENYAPLLVENIRKGGFTHIFAGHTAFGKNLMPRVAALLDTQQISDVIAVEDEDSTSIHRSCTARD